MRLVRLRAQQLRLFEAFDLEVCDGINLFVGPNGAGKTSIIEAAYLLGYGRSFRSGPRDVMVRRGAAELSVFGEVVGDGVTHRLGLRRAAREWEARLDGDAVPALSELFRYCPVVLFEPGSHALIGGEAELRRRFVDWGLFHVEPDFLPCWRRYQRALRQRNAALRSGATAEVDLEPWEQELDQAGSRLHRQRVAYLETLDPIVSEVSGLLFPAAGAARFDYSAGWRTDECALAEALRGSRERDAALGYTTVGPHRANWSLRLDAISDRHALSRGQEKLAALVCVLSQGRHYADQRGGWPIVCLDDLGSELDRTHQQRVVDWLQSHGPQVLLSGTEAPAGLGEGRGAATFHVEQGQIRRLL